MIKNKKSNNIISKELKSFGSSKDNIKNINAYYTNITNNKDESIKNDNLKNLKYND